MSDEIQRYESDGGGMDSHPHGFYVMYADHAAKVAALENELCTAKDQLPPDEEDLSRGLIRLKDKVAALEAERDGWKNVVYEEMEENVKLFQSLGVMKEVELAEKCSASLVVEGIERLKAERDTLQRENERLREALKLAMQAFDYKWPGACAQDCFDTSNGHGYEMQEAAREKAKAALASDAGKE